MSDPRNTISFIRLLELAGFRIDEVLTPRQAASVFLAHGAEPQDLATKAGIKAARNRLVRAAHSDIHGGDDAIAKEVNAAYDVLKLLPNGYDATNTGPQHMPDRETDKGPPPWQTDPRGSSSIYRQDYTDINFFKKRMWELSRRSRHRYHLWAFDGHFFRRSLEVFGARTIYDEMAKAMVIWNSHGGNPYATRAVFAQPAGSDALHLIYLDGKTYDGSITFEHESFNRNPSNDQGFVRRLPELLDQVEHG